MGFLILGILQSWVAWTAGGDARWPFSSNHHEDPSKISRCSGKNWISEDCWTQVFGTMKLRFQINSKVTGKWNIKTMTKHFTKGRIHLPFINWKSKTPQGCVLWSLVLRRFHNITFWIRWSPKVWTKWVWCKSPLTLYYILNTLHYPHKLLYFPWNTENIFIKGKNLIKNVIYLFINVGSALQQAS